MDTSAVRKLILILSVIYVSNCFSQQYWIEQQCPTTKVPHRLSFPDSLSGWAVGDSGIIVHTSNGGTNWFVQQSNITSRIEDICFASNNTGWALSNDFLFTGTILLNTTNGGLNWSQSRFPDSSIVFQSVLFINELTGFLGGFAESDRAGNIMKTTNNGLNWTKCVMDLNLCNHFPILRINFYNSLTGYACGGVFDQGGVYWKTTDGGLHWIDSCIASEPLFDVLPISDNVIIATGGDFEYGAYNYTSSDAGITWRPLSLNLFGLSQRVARRTAGEYWIPCADAGKFSVSTDSARTWKTIDTPDSVRFYDTRFTDQTHGWSVGCKNYNCVGAIFKYNPVVIGLPNNQNNVPISIELLQNFPNPFNPVTSIIYRINKSGKVKIAIYDATGKFTKQLLNGFYNPGEYKIDFDGTDFPSGVYFCKMEATDVTISKKMVLLK